MQVNRKLAAILTGLMLAGAAAAPGAMAGVPEPDPKDGKCNSGRGNGAEVAGADCDPGNSAGHNQGGDE